jgi:MFS family permease
MTTPAGRPSRPKDRPGLRSLMANRDFRLLWTGMTVSFVGDGVFLVALAWQVYALSNAPTALSAVGLAITIPHVAFLLAGGVVSDRFDRRRVMVAADVLRCASIAAIGVLSLRHSLHLWHLIGLAGLYGAGTAFFGPAFDAIIPELVPEDALTSANSLDQLARPAALRLLGPALGGFVIAAWGLGTAFLLDAATYVASVAALLAMSPAPASPHDRSRSAVGEILEGFRYVRSHVWLWGTLLAATVAYLLFMGPVEVLVPFVVKNDLHRGASVLGFVFAMGGLGAIGGALFMGRTGIPRRSITFMYLTWTVATIAVAGYGVATMPWQAMAASFAFNALETAGTIVWATTKQRLVPNRLLGRVSSLDWFVSIGLLPLSFALTGPVATILGARATLVWAGLLGGAVTLAALFLPGMRAVERERAIDAAGSDAGLATVGPYAIGPAMAERS